MDFRNHVIKFRPYIQLPQGHGIASTPVEALAPEDIEVECMALFMLQAQGKLIPLEDVLEELRTDMD